MSVRQWIERTKAISFIVKAGRYGGTHAHKDIAFHFARWLSPEYVVTLDRFPSCTTYKGIRQLHLREFLKQNGGIAVRRFSVVL